jgi:hypothetical protein
MESNPPQGEVWRLEASPGKGLGLFATRRIPAGECVLAERPVLVFPSVTHAVLGPGGAPVAKVLLSCTEILDRLRPEELAIVLDLYCPDYLDEVVKEVPGSETVRSVLKILLANGLIGDQEDDVPDSEKRVELFPWLSRINPSCGPNVLPTERRGSLVRTIAIRDIEQGEELLNSYVQFMAPKQQRLEALARWRVPCTCPACSLEGAALAGDDAARTLVGETAGAEDLLARLQATAPAVLLRCSASSPDALLRRLLEQQAAVLRAARGLGAVAVLQMPSILAGCYLLGRRLHAAGSLHPHTDMLDIFGPTLDYNSLKEEASRIAHIIGQNFEEKFFAKLELIDSSCDEGSDSH